MSYPNKAKAIPKKPWTLKRNIYKLSMKWLVFVPLNGQGYVMKRDAHEKRLYAWRRLSRAVDRQITSAGEAKKRAALWAKVWGARAGFSGALSR